jgi:hypothetical protein
MAGRWRHKAIRNTDISIGGSVVQCDAHGFISGDVTEKVVAIMEALPDFDHQAAEETTAPEKAPAPKVAAEEKPAAPKKAVPKKAVSKKKSSPKK